MCVGPLEYVWNFVYILNRVDSNLEKHSFKLNMVAQMGSRQRQADPCESEARLLYVNIESTYATE